MVRPTINSEKHIIQNSLETVTAAAVVTNVLGQAVDVPGTSNTDVRVGAVIKAVYNEKWVRTSDTSPGSFVYIIYKLPNGLPFPTAIDMAALNDWSNKNNILYTTQAISNVNTADAIPLHKGWVKIPKGKQRMSLGDVIAVSTFAQALDQVICGVSIYKEYF